jgi:hypothetical protein
VRQVRSGLLNQQAQRALALQNELLSDPLVDLRTVRQALGIGYETLNRLIARGLLTSFRIGPRGQRKIRLSSLRKLLAQSEQPQPPAVKL